ncbi:calcium uniporter protein 3, mitochondrial-like [Tasmannia lanceolata]|uniref:calcium uniporter protein 3, mitochondrial-like n=1 Tax=Tasmannia lanceolata TaxID=3420 RepID=UPI0040629E6F
MAFAKTLARRLFNFPTKNPPQTLTHYYKTLTPPNHYRKFLPPPEPGENGFFRPPLPIGDKLIENLNGMNRDRLRFEGLTHPSHRPSDVPSQNPLEGISVKDAKKLLKIARLEILKGRLRYTPKNCVLYSEFLQICEGFVEGSNPEEISELAKMLDESGEVIVLGNLVFLRPDQVIKAMGLVIPLSISQPNDPRRKELEKMEKEKVAIDERAEAMVRRELWCGLGFLVLQTAGFFRLTFWELSWDVMEPICFYVTSIYFMAGYTFFLRTSKDPSFEGYFESRFSAKQRHLMKAKKFDVETFNELRRAFDSSEFSSFSSSHDSHRRTLIGADMHH